MTDTGNNDQDVVDFLSSDHPLMLGLVDQIRQATDPQQRRDVADTLVAEVMRHAVAEEMYVYPMIEKLVPDGAQVGGTTRRSTTSSSTS